MRDRRIASKLLFSTLDHTAKAARIAAITIVALALVSDATAQTGTAKMNGALTAGSVNNVYQVDGITNATIQSIYNNSTFNGGEIDWYPPASTPNVPPYPYDLFQNRTTPPLAVANISINTSCTTTHGSVSEYLHGFPYYLAVWQVQYDASGNADWSAPVVQQEPLGSSNCYQVSPSPAIFGGNGSGNGAGYVTLAQECAALCTSPYKPTIQWATEPGKVGNFYFVDTTVTRTYNYTSFANPGTFSPFNSNFVPINNNGGVQVLNTHVQLGAGNFTLFPFTLGQYDTVKGLGRGVTTISLSQSAPNAIPWLPANGVLTKGGTESAGYTRSVIVALLEDLGLGSGSMITSLSPLFSLPAFSSTCPSASGFCSESMYAPAPPYIAQTEQSNTFYPAGERVTDDCGGNCITNPSPSVWMATISGTTGGSVNLGHQCTPSSGGVGTTVVDGATWVCIVMGQLFSSVVGTSLAVGSEIYDPTALDPQGNATGGYLEVVVAGTLVSSTPTPGLCVGCTTNLLIDGYKYTNLGLTLVARPSYEWFTISQAATAQHITGANPPLLDTTKGKQYVWSACSNTAYVGVTPTGNCPATYGSQQTVSLLNDTTLGALPTFTPSDIGECDSTFSTINGVTNCNISPGIYQLFLLWNTPTGTSPKAAYTLYQQFAADHGIRIPWSQLPPPPPNATGWTISACVSLTNNFDCPDFVQAVDGYHVACAGSANPSNQPFIPSGYVTGYTRGGACALGFDLYLLAAQKASPYSPSQGASDNFAMIGATGNQTAAGIPFLNGSTLDCYNCRIDALTMEMGPQRDITEPFGVGILDQLGQEGSGVGYDGGCVQVSDATLAGLYHYSNAGQNSGSNCFHYTGAIYDYSVGEIIENVPGPRRFSNFSAMGPLQGGPFVARAGVWVNATNGALQPTISISDVETEASFCGVRVDNASAVITNFLSGGPPGRITVNGVCLGPFAHDSSVLLSTAGNTNGCPLWNESPSAIWNFLSTATDQCDATKFQTLGFYWEGNNAGTGGSSLPICSSDLFEGCSPASTNTCGANSASPAACGNARAGSFAVPSLTTSYTVNSTAVTASSTILVQNIQDPSGFSGSPPICSTTYNPPVQVSRTVHTSFTVSLLGSVAATECYSFEIIN